VIAFFAASICHPDSDTRAGSLAVLQHAARPCLNTPFVHAGNLPSLSASRIGLAWKAPLQFGQRSPSIVVEHSEQNVHSKLQISASVTSGGRSLLQHSQHRGPPKLF
jgi:hypothetical protein